MGHDVASSDRGSMGTRVSPSGGWANDGRDGGADLRVALATPCGPHFAAAYREKVVGACRLTANLNYSRTARVEGECVSVRLRSRKPGPLPLQLNLRKRWR